ncbi:helix-turn-helix domain-containing protein [Pseudomonadota bacterium]
MDASRYLLQLSRYIHRNPIELRRPLVSAPEAYVWSSYSAYLNQCRAPEWLNRDAVYGELGSRYQYSAYRAYVESGNDDETTRFYSLKNTPSILGDKSFKENAYRKAQSLDIEIDKKGMKVPVSLETIVGRVATFYKIEIKGIVVTKRGKGQQNLPRWIAMKLCQEVGSAKLHEIAKLFHVGHYSTVSQTIGRLNRLMEKDTEVFKIYNVLSQDLTL